MVCFQSAVFHTSINDARNLPHNFGIEVAFAGRSNAGKSSVINALTRRNRLAFVSKTPGRTQHINFFKLDTGQFLVDLPGYGYAKVPYPVRKQWEELLSGYLQTREALKGLILIMDIRQPLKILDIQMLEWFALTGKATHILLTKADKISKQQANLVLNEVNSFLKRNAYSKCSVQLFSSLSTIGIEEAKYVINKWLTEN